MATKTPKKKIAALTTRMPAAERELQLLDAAVKASEKVGFQSVTRDQVAAIANVSPCLLTRYFHTMGGMRDAIVKHAIATGSARVVCEAILARNKLAMKAAPAFKDRINELLFK